MKRPNYKDPHYIIFFISSESKEFLSQQSPCVIINLNICCILKVKDQVPDLVKKNKTKIIIICIFKFSAVLGQCGKIYIS